MLAAGFTTAFGAHAVAATLGTTTTGTAASLLTLGALLAIYDGAEVVLKPVFGTLADRIGVRTFLSGLSPVVTGAAVSVLALTTALAQPLVGRALDAGRLALGAGITTGVVLTAVGLIAVTLPGLLGLLCAGLVGLRRGVTAAYAMARRLPPSDSGRPWGPPRSAASAVTRRGHWWSRRSPRFPASRSDSPDWPC